MYGKTPAWVYLLALLLLIVIMLLGAQLSKVIGTLA